jgi:hypothetical protein
MRQFCLTIAVVCVIAAALITPANATCPAFATTNATLALTGGNPSQLWAFSLSSSGKVGTIGRFTVFASTNPGAPSSFFLTTTATTNSLTTGIVQQGQYSGRGYILPDCTGGSMVLVPDGEGGPNRTFDFVLNSTQTSMSLVDDANMPGFNEVGSAGIVSPTCPAGNTNPLLGTTWRYSLSGTSSSTGTFVVTNVISTNPFNGVEDAVTATENPTTGPSLNNGAIWQGVTQTDGSCQFGTIMLGPSGQLSTPTARGQEGSLRDYAFTFTNSTDTSMSIVSVNDDGSVLTGTATKQ